MSENGIEQVIGSAVMQKEQTLTEPPLRRGAKLVGAGGALRDTVSQAIAHVMKREIENRCTGWRFRAAVEESPVIIVSVWQPVHPIATASACPFWIEDEQLLSGQAGAGPETS